MFRFCYNLKIGYWMFIHTVILLYTYCHARGYFFQFGISFSVCGSGTPHELPPPCSHSNSIVWKWGRKERRTKEGEGRYVCLSMRARMLSDPKKGSCHHKDKPRPSVRKIASKYVHCYPFIRLKIKWNSGCHACIHLRNSRSTKVKACIGLYE